MEFVLSGLFLIGAVLLIFWGLALRNSILGDRAARLLQQQTEAKQQENDAQEARMHQPGETLRCLGCEATFASPLPPEGCPQCHLASLITLDSEHRSSHYGNETPTP